MRTLQKVARHAAGIAGIESPLVRAARPVYQRTLTWLGGDRGIPWVINGNPFRIDASQRHRMGEVYDPRVAAYLSANVQPGSTCLDVGANVGVYALQFAHWTGPAGRVVAFEPNPIAAIALENHIRMNGFGGHVQVIQAAVAERSGTRTFHMADADGMSRLGAPNPEIAQLTQAVEVMVTTLDEYCAAERTSPDWLLIDVEGFEFSVLAGARETIARLRGTLNVIVEMHPDAWSVAGWTREMAQALLDSFGAEVVSLSGHADPLAEWGHVLLRTGGSPRAGD